MKIKITYHEDSDPGIGKYALITCDELPGEVWNTTQKSKTWDDVVKEAKEIAKYAADYVTERIKLEGRKPKDEEYEVDI